MPWSLNGSEAGGGPYFVTNHHVHGLASIRITRFALENSKHLKIRWKQLILFFEKCFNVSRGEAERNIEIRYIAGNFETENSLNLAVTAVIGQHYSAVVASDIIDFAMLPAQSFRRGNSIIVRCHVDLEVTNESAFWSVT